MAHEELREKGLIEDVKPSPSAVSTYLTRALKDLATARANLSIDREWAFAIAYQGMLRAARGMIAAEGLRTRGRDQQRTIVAVSAGILGEDSSALVNAFDRMRRRWQTIMEEPGQPISRYEVEGALKSAQSFIERVVEVTREKNPQLSML
ncbi:MAG TPA: HEPN domain-containing protein [Candidatus Sulfotelmatobacter sp.]|nr:HEPN domain-containing protein [Candidatus Sulfotelmatobacter sp.]